MKTVLKLFFVMMVSALWACGPGNGDVKNGVKPANGEKVMTLKHAWQPVNMSLGSNRVAMHDDQIIYMQRYQETINVIFAGIDGKEMKKIVLDRGKGPGELMFPLNIEVDENGIFICDSGLRRITRYDLDGVYDDSFEMSNETGMIFLSDIKNNKMVFNSFNETLLGIMNIRDGQVTHKIAHEKQGFPGNDDLYKGCGLVFDTGTDNFYAAWSNSPYRIEVYDSEMNLIKTIYKKINFEMDDPTWFIEQGNLDMQGDFLMASIAVDDNYIYTPSHEMSVMFEGGIEVGQINASICVFDKKSGKFLWELTIDKLRKYKGTLTVLGADKDNVTVMVNTTDGSLDSIVERDESKVTQALTGADGLRVSQAMLVFDNPLYD